MAYHGWLGPHSSGPRVDCVLFLHTNYAIKCCTQQVLMLSRLPWQLCLFTLAEAVVEQGGDGGGGGLLVVPCDDQIECAALCGGQ